MKKWSIRTKKENTKKFKPPKQKVNRSFKEILKLNFLPLIFILYAVIVISIGAYLIIGDWGPSEASNISGGSDTTATLTAKQFLEDMTLDTDWATYTIIDYASLKTGDSVIIQDKITSILYNSELDATKITFQWDSGGETPPLNLYFAGDITATYGEEDTVKITLTIKRIQCTTYEGMSMDIEIFKEQWMTADDYKETLESDLQGFKPISPSYIEKV